MEDLHTYVSILCGHCGNTFQVPVYCGNRFCPTCNLQRRKRVRYKISKFVSTRRLRSGDSFKLLTLSVPNQDNVKSQVVLLLSSFRRLRQRAFWKKAVRGGATVVEITKSESGWHAHLHCIIESQFVPWASLKLHWEAVSGGLGCHITRIPASAIVRYVTKYVTKSDLKLADQFTASDALKGTRLFQPFGEWHNPINQISVPRAFCTVCEHANFVFNPYDTAAEYASRLPSADHREVLERAGPNRDASRFGPQMTFGGILHDVHPQ